MSPEEFTNALNAKAKEIQRYANTRYPSVAGNIALRLSMVILELRDFRDKVLIVGKKAENREVAP